MAPTRLPRVKRERIAISKYDLVTISLCDKTGKPVAVVEFDRLADKKPKITFAAKGSTMISDA